MKRRPHRRRRNRSHPRPDYDVEALALIACCKGTISLDGEALPLIHPLGLWLDITDFDRQVCAARLKVFIRPVAPSDLPDPDRIVRGDPAIVEAMKKDWSPDKYVLVREAAPGIRSRLGISVAFRERH
jgi:hypothetical protein